MVFIPTVASRLRTLGRTPVSQVLNYATRKTKPVRNLFARVEDNLSLVQDVPGLKVAALAAKGRAGAAIASGLGGDALEAASRVAGRGIQTSRRAYRRGIRGVKPQTIGMVRGTTTGITKNRRLIGDALTGGGFTVASKVNKLLNASPIGRTAVGRTLTKDISAPIYKTARVRQRLRSATSGLFMSSFC